MEIALFVNLFSLLVVVIINAVKKQDKSQLIYPIIFHIILIYCILLSAHLWK